MRFFTDFEEFIFEDSAQYPATKPVELMQVTDRTAGGTTHTETYALPISGRALTFKLMSLADYQGLVNWFINVAEGQANPFSFEDERGEISVVKFTTRAINFPEISYNRFSGKLGLENQNA